MDLQLFAESGGDEGRAGDAGSGDGDGAGEIETGENPPTVEELLAQLSAERAKSAKLQNEKDKASSEAASFKNQLRAKMTSDEQAEAAKAEAEARREAEFQQMKEEIRVNKYSKRFMGVGMDEATATELAGLTGELTEPDKFFSALDKFVKAAVKKAGEDSVEALIKSNPTVKAGNGSPEKGALAKEKAIASAKRMGGVNENILNQYRR